MSDVTRILGAIERGDGRAAEQLLPLVYDELRKLAAAKLAREKLGQTLQATALVHEAYLRLVDVVQGLACYYRGDTSQANRSFKEAVNMDSANVSARAMQAVATLFSGDLSEYSRLTKALSDLQPRNEYRTYDELFLAYAMLYEDPAETARITKNILDESSHWGLLGVIRAEALGHLALDTGNYQYIEEARQELRSAETTIGDNPFVLVTNLYIHILALRFRGQDEARGELERRAELLVERLQQCDSPISHGTIAVYYDFITEEYDKAYDEWRWCADSDLLRNQIAAALFYFEKLSEAQSITAGPGTTNAPLTLIAKAYLDFLTADSDRQNQMWAEIQKLTEETNPVEVRSSVLPVYLARGKLDTAKKLGEELLGKPDHLTGRKTSAQFAADELLIRFVIDENRDALIKAVGSSRKRLCDAHFIIAMWYLGRGQRVDAIREFAACLSTNQINRDSFYWARAFHKKLLDDENWPYASGDKGVPSHEDKLP